nr:unnamed protein product [uncultured bacterium]
MAVKNVKKRNWAFVAYPDSLPDGWLDTLCQTGLQCAVSPLHDKDIDPTGEIKKPHYHVIACYSGPTSYNVVKSLTDQFNAPGPQPLEQVRGYYRYLTHKDNPEKAQYSENDIQTINGFCILDFVELTKSEVLTIKKELQTLIRDADILEYSDFMDLLQDSDMTQQYDVASCNTYFFEKYISSRRNKKRLIQDNGKI